MSRTSHRSNVALWAVQVVLAALFLFAGGMKLTMPAAVLAQLTGLPGAFMKLIAVAEIAGGLGLVLPGIFRLARGLTPAAAVGLVTIMAGATTVTALHGPVPQAVMPLAVGILAGAVARGRRAWLPSRASDLPGAAWVGTPIQTH